MRGEGGYFLGMWMTLAMAPGALAEGADLRKKTGATFHCWPFSVMTVTDFLLYLAMMPVNNGCPSGWNETLSPMLKSSM